MSMPVNETDRFTLRGRSIDGTVYWDGYDWSSDKNDAKLMPWAEACKAMDNRREQNKQSDHDDMIGRLVID